MKGIDVSVHNGDIDWGKVKATGIDFAILRAGYGKLAKQKDAKFEDNYKGAKAAGIPVGAYWYSYATTPDEAKLEAEVLSRERSCDSHRQRSNSCENSATKSVSLTDFLCCNRTEAAKIVCRQESIAQG